MKYYTLKDAPPNNCWRSSLYYFYKTDKIVALDLFNKSIFEPSYIYDNIAVSWISKDEFENKLLELL